MNIDSENIVPTRRPSGRLSKPSMELLVDHQRLLAHNVEPKKKRRVEIKKVIEEIGSQSNYSEKSSLSSTEKYKPKRKKRNDEIDKINVKYQQILDESAEEISNEEKHIDNGVKNASITGCGLLNRTPYVAIELNDIVINNSPELAIKTPEKFLKFPDKIIKSVEKKNNNFELTTKSPEKSVKYSDKFLENINDIIDNKSEDDLPLSKIYPDYKPRSNESTDKRDTFTLPPKKKIKFININELNGSSDKQSISPLKVPKLKLVFSPTKASVMSMPKIPKKYPLSSPQQNGSSDSENHNSSPPSIKSTENLSICETHATPSTCTNLTSPITHQTTFENNKRCIRQSCTNIAIEDFRWDKEFCSPDCAIMYSKFLFNEWLNQRRDLAVSE